MSERGYIKFYRSTLEHQFFRDDAERMAWLRLLSATAWKPHKKRAGEFFVDLQRGEVVGAVRYLASEWQWSKGKVERFLIRLKNEEMIETRTETGITIITICKYNEFQGGDEDDGTPMDREPGQGRDRAGTGPGQGRDRAGDKKEEIKHSRKEEGEELLVALGQAAERQPSLPALMSETGEASVPARKRRAKPRSVLDPDWRLPEDSRQYARDRSWTNRDIDFQFEKFTNFHIAKGNLMADWPAAWRTWVGNGYGPRGPTSGGAPVRSRADSTAEGILAGMEAHEQFDP